VTLQALRSKVFQSHASHRYAKAIELVESHWDVLTDKRGELTYWLVCLYSLVGRLDDAFGLITNTMREGVMLPPTMLRSDPDLEAFRADEWYPKLIDGLKVIHEARTDEARPSIEFAVPSDTPTFDTAALLLHGNNSNAQEALSQWRVILPASWLLAAVTSREPSQQEAGHLWSDADARASTLRSTLPLFQSTARDSSIVVVGFSLGCTAALEAVMFMAKPIDLVILAAPSVNAERLRQYDCYGLIRRLLVFAGDSDSTAIQVADLVTDLAESGGTKATTLVFGHLGHEYPPPEQAANAVHQILTEESSI
jgi:predicted esterase